MSTPFGQPPLVIVAQPARQQQPAVVQQPSQQQPAASGSGRLRATEAQLRVFLRGIDAMLMQWTALNLVCQGSIEAGEGALAAEALRADLRDWFVEMGEIYSDELEGFFDDFFANERSAEVQDGSMKEVADAMHAMYRQCCANDDTLVARFEHTLPAYQASNTLSHCVRFRAPGHEDVSDDDDGDAALQDEEFDDDSDEGDSYGDDGALYAPAHRDDGGGFARSHNGAARGGDGAPLDEDGAPRTRKQNAAPGGGGGGGGGWKAVGRRR